MSPLKFGLYFGSQNNFVMSKLEISLLDSSSDEEISEIVEKTNQNQSFHPNAGALMVVLHVTKEISATFKLPMITEW